MSAGYNLSDAKEVEQYSKNIGIEFRFSCYNEKNPDGCHLLGDYLESIHSDIARALKVYLHNCNEHNFAKSCFKYAAYRHMGKGCTKDDAVAFKYFEKGCNSGEPQSCLLAGVIATSTKDDSTSAENEASLVEAGGRDYVKGKDFLSTACLANNAEACHRYSSLYILGHEQVAKDMTTAFSFANKACQLGHPQSCANLSIMYRKGEGTAKNHILAEKFKKLTMELVKEMKKRQQEMKLT